MAKTLSARAWGAHFLPAIKMVYKLVQLKLSSLTLLNVATMTLKTLVNVTTVALWVQIIHLKTERSCIIITKS